MVTDSTKIFTLLNSIQFDKQFGTKDANAIEVALDMLAASPVNGPKRVFVFTDGYSTCGLNLSQVQLRAEASDIDVVGIGVFLFTQIIIYFCF